jgi:hypothetical protein
MASDLENMQTMINYNAKLNKDNLVTIDLPDAMKYFKMTSDLENLQSKINYDIELKKTLLE